MKVVHIAECAGGVERYLQMLIPLLNNYGAKQSLICSQNFKKSNFYRNVDGFYQIEMYQSFSPLTVWETIGRIRTILKHERPDIIYCHSSFGGTFGRLASIGLEAKVVYNPHGWSFNDQHILSIKRKVYVLIERLFSHLTDRYVAISNFEKSNALRFNITQSSKIEVIRNGLEIDKYYNRQKENREELGIPDEACVIGMVGRLTVGKSPDIFVKMAAILKQKIPNAFFIIVGDGEERESVEKLIKENKLSDSFMITGWVDNVYDYEDAFDYAVLLTKWEGFGLAVAEYMLCKKPLISTRVGGIPDIVKDGYNGLLINEIDEKSAATAVLKLYNDKSLANKLADNAYNFALKDLDITRTAAEHYSLFKSLLQDR
jgi:glycosyltransferase involved in cell wall biosynthesis